MAQPLPSSDLPSSSDFISKLSGDSGYRPDVSGRMSNSIGDGDDYSISSKEEGYQRDDSRDLEEMAAEEGVPTEQKTKERPPIARKRVKQRVYRSEEETQIIPLSLGHYVDHSLDPVIDEPPFAPLQRQANFPEILFAILSNQHLEDIITWMPHGVSSFLFLRCAFYVFDLTKSPSICFPESGRLPSWIEISLCRAFCQFTSKPQEWLVSRSSLMHMAL